MDRLGIEATSRGNLPEGLALGKARLDLLIAVHTCGVPSEGELLGAVANAHTGAGAALQGPLPVSLESSRERLGAARHGLCGSRRLRCLCGDQRRRRGSLGR